MMMAMRRCKLMMMIDAFAPTPEEIASEENEEPTMMKHAEM